MTSTIRQSDTVGEKAVELAPALTMEVGSVGKHNDEKDIDDAFEYVTTNAVHDISPENKKRLLRKIDLFLMPVNINTSQYAWSSGSVFYLAYMVSQPIISRLMLRLPIGRFVSIMVILWGIILMTTAASRSFASLMTIRALLGAVESCINPAFVVMTSQWYTRREQPARIGYWFLGNAIGQILGGVIGYGVGHIHYGTVGDWIWFFIIFGTITIIYGVFLLFFLPDSPMTARWLSESDRRLAMARVLKNRTGFVNHKWKRSQFWECIFDPKTWFLFTYSIVNTIPSGGVASFGNIVIKGFGYSELNTTLLQMPLGAIQATSILICGYVTSHHKNMRSTVAAVTQIPGLIGAVLLYVLPTSNSGGRLASYYIIQTHSVSLVMAWSLLSANFAGFTKKSTASAICFIAFCAGQVIGPQLFIESQEPRYDSAFVAAFVCFSILIVLPYVLQMYLIRENKRRDKMCLEMGIAANDEDTTEGLLDLTDIEQKIRFRYVY